MGWMDRSRVKHTGRWDTERITAFSSLCSRCVFLWLTDYILQQWSDSFPLHSEVFHCKHTLTHTQDQDTKVLVSRSNNYKPNIRGHRKKTKTIKLSSFACFGSNLTLFKWFGSSDETREFWTSKFRLHPREWMKTKMVTLFLYNEVVVFPTKAWL